MAIYHLSTKPISRSSGRSAVASVAYRAGIEITDERLGKTYDYTKRSGVLWTGMATPNGLEIDRSELWNRAEKVETRSNSRTAREIVINIPHELMQGDQSAGKMLAYEFATNLSQKYQIAVDIAVHSPDKQGDNRNYHAHLLLTTRQITQEQDGRFELGKKSQLEMSNAQLKQAGLLSNQDELKEIRREWAQLANEYLAEHNMDARIDHRSHKDRGLETLPTIKMGWKATELERQGIRTEVGDQNRAIKAYNAQVELKNGLKEQVKAEKLAINEFRTPTTNQNTLKTQNDANSNLLSSEQYRQTVEFLREFNDQLEQQRQTIQEFKGKLSNYDLIEYSKQMIPSDDDFNRKISEIKKDIQALETKAEKHILSDWDMTQYKNKVTIINSLDEIAIERAKYDQYGNRIMSDMSKSPLEQDYKPQTPQEIVKELGERIEKIAKNILINQLKELEYKGKLIQNKIDTLMDNKPSFISFFEKGKWEKDKKQALNAYNAIKEQHDTIRINGITDEHRKQANEQLAKDDPDYYKKGQQAKFEIIWQILDERDEKAKQYGADEQAKPSQTYNGKIIKSNDKISLQETKNGVVLHRIGELEVGKIYTLTLDIYEEKYSIKKYDEIELQKTQDYQNHKQSNRNDDRVR